MGKLQTAMLHPWRALREKRMPFVGAFQTRVLNVINAQSWQQMPLVEQSFEIPVSLTICDFTKVEEELMTWSWRENKQFVYFVM